MGENKNIPQIRFNGFDESWEVKKLGEIGFTYSGLFGKSKIDFGHGEGKYITYMNIFSNPITNVDITAPIEIDINQNEVEFGDVFFTTSSETPEEVGMTSVWLGSGKNTYLNSFCFGYRLTEELDSYFIAYLLRSFNIRKKITYLAQGISRYNISKNKVMQICISRPKISEQYHIGSYFQNLDKLITLQQQKHDKLVTLKKAMLDKMFPKEGADVPEIRFKGFKDKWEKRKLKEISIKVTEKNTPIRYCETFTNSAEYGIISQRDYFDNDISNSDNIDRYYVVKNDDFVYNPRISSFAPVGPINRNRLGRNGIMSPLYTVFRTQDVDVTFLEHFFKTDCWHTFMRLNGDTGARSDRFSIKDFLFVEMPIPFPKIEEQSQIGSYFQNLDKLISLHQQEIQKLKNIKKACLEKMFV
ncbi:restriction endonuclease subunit S [Petrimonas sp.]|jgi:type I restriction enzyme S subunit|uniref:restriction endonuclease subunit S n=1 Tax=Petrimonas sp. TaxID=2023866 RepID=UPI003325DBEA